MLVTILAASGALCVFAIICKLSVDNSNSQMWELLPEAEMKLQLAIYKLEEKQAEKNAKNELNKRKRKQERKMQKKKERCERKKKEQEEELDRKLANLSNIGSPI